jgi:hypothetical protein
MLKGRLAEAEQNKKNLKIRIEALIRTMRVELDPYKDPLDTNILAVADEMNLLLAAHRDYAEVTALIERLKKDLGE